MCSSPCRWYLRRSLRYWPIKAYKNYLNSVRLERAKWAERLYSKFYELDEVSPLRRIRIQLDCPAGDTGVQELVDGEDESLMEYLNFFELLAYLEASKQLARKDVLALFDYYLRCLKKHPALHRYIQNRESGFENLRKLLSHIR